MVSTVLIPGFTLALGFLLGGIISPPDAVSATEKQTSLRRFQVVYLELLEHQRGILERMNQLAECEEGLIRKYLALIDMEEYKVREKRPEDIKEV